jgi:glycosyltransferase involved in cell wall biosynthesis
VAKELAPAVSIIMPAFNSEAYIAEAVESVLAQQGPPFELLIGNDASTDETMRAIEPFGSDPRVRVFDFPVNRGSAHVCNTLRGHARGRYVTPCDADDVMLAGCLCVQYQFLENHPDIGVCYGDILILDQILRK